MELADVGSSLTAQGAGAQCALAQAPGEAPLLSLGFGAGSLPPPQAVRNSARHSAPARSKGGVMRADGGNRRETDLFIYRKFELTSKDELQRCADEGRACTAKRVAAVAGTNPAHTPLN